MNMIQSTASQANQEVAKDATTYFDGEPSSSAVADEWLLSGLRAIRRARPTPQTAGLSDAAIRRFIDVDPKLRKAIVQAVQGHAAMAEAHDDALGAAEAELCESVQQGYLNFYGAEARSPYLPLAAAGPWIVTTHGAVLHDSGGYGMLGMGHAPDAVLEALGKPWVMANVMTPSLSQQRFAKRLKQQIGRARQSCPFERFVCLNSGSEAVTMACRLSDIHAFRQTEPGARAAGKAIQLLSLSGSFHGRTYRPAWLSHSTQSIYRTNLASFRDQDLLRTVEPNDVGGLVAAFEQAEAEGVWFECLVIEPVLGEGRPGLALRRDFYDAARKLSSKHGTLLLVDSIQAALRAHGCLSIVDYPGFEDCEPPDMETYSKALNAGQYPLSVLALSKAAAELYVIGAYGNTMTTNPRALEVGCAVLDGLSDSLRRNIRDRGAELVAKLKALASELPGAIREVTGTGLMVCAELAPDRYCVEGADGVEAHLRRRGIVMIHGGENGLRFTPHFAITSAEVDLIVESVGEVLRELGRH